MKSITITDQVKAILGTAVNEAILLPKSNIQQRAIIVVRFADRSDWLLFTDSPEFETQRANVVTKNISDKERQTILAACRLLGYI